MAIDELGQAGKDIPLPDDITNRIENARNNVTILDAETARLTKIVKVETDKIHALVAEKHELVTSIEKLKATLEQTTTDVANKKIELAGVENKVILATKTVSDLENSAAKSTADLTQRSAQLDARETAANEMETKLNDRHITLTASEALHSAKVEKLKKALE